MRKLSKKISMLMVLAMLVSLFSGVVSASAASAWSFYNKTADDSIVAYAKENYEMEPNQFADFDLYKNDEIIDTDVYTVVYESSDEDVVWVNAKSGKLRAQKDAEIGATAEITAHITNKVNGAKADRSFTIEIVAAEVEEPTAEPTPTEVPVVEVEYAFEYDFADTAFVVGLAYDLSAVLTADGVATDAKVAVSVDGKALEGKFAPAKEGDYTIVLTATVDEVEYTSEPIVVTAVVDNSFTVKQSSMTSFTMTFTEGLDMSKVTKADVAVAEAGSIDGAKVVVPVKNISGEGNVVTVELYQGVAKDNYIFAKYLDGEYAGFKVAKGNVAKVVVASKAVMVNAFSDLDIKLYDENEVEITNPELLGKVTIEVVAGKEDCALDGSKILFWAKEKRAEVVAVYHTGDYMTNNDGTEVVIKSEAAAISSKETVVTYSGVDTWALADADSDWTKLTYASSVKLSLSDSGKKIAGKLTETTVTTKVDTKTVYTKDLGYVFESADPAKLLVAADGTLIPIATGSVDVLMKDSEGKIKSVAPVVIIAAREKSSIAITGISKSTMSTVAGDKIEVTISVKDQFGDACTVVEDDITLNDATQASKPEVTINGTNISYSNNKLTFKGLAAGTYTYSITVNKKVAYVSFKVQAPEAAATYKLDATTKNLSTNIAGNGDKTLDAAYADAVVSIAAYDKYNYLTAETTPIVQKIDSAATVAVGNGIAAGNFYVVLSGPNGYKDWIDVVDGNVVLDNLKVEGNVIKKAPAGTYTVTLYKAAAVGTTGKVSFSYQDSISINVADGQPGYTAKLNKNVSTQAYNDVFVVSGSAVTISGSAVEAVIDECFEIYNAKSEKVSLDGYYAVEEKHANKTIVLYSVKFNEEFTFADDTYCVEQKINLLTSPITLQ